MAEAMSDAAPCFSLMWISRRAEPSSRHESNLYLAEKEARAPCFRRLMIEIDGKTACWKMFRHAPILSRWSKITPLRSGLSPIFCAMVASAGRSAKTDRFAIDPPCRTRQNLRPLPTPPRRWRSRSLTGGRPDGSKSFCRVRARTHLCRGRCVIRHWVSTPIGVINCWSQTDQAGQRSRRMTV